MGDYFRHWLDMGKKLTKQPKIFNVNWFRLDENGKFIWPGFGENFRVLQWILKRCEDRVEAVESPIGDLPRPEDICLDGLDDFTTEDVAELLTVDKAVWETEVADIEAHFAKFDHLPQELKDQLAALKARLAVYNG